MEKQLTSIANKKAETELRVHDIEGVKSWFRDRVQAWKDDPVRTPRISRDKLLEQVRANPFPGLSSSVWRGVWKELAPPGWRRPGRIKLGD
jgi:hypothetical protein